MVTQQQFLSTTLKAEKPTFRKISTVNFFSNFEKLFLTLKPTKLPIFKKFCKNDSEKFQIMRFSRSFCLLLTEIFLSIRTKIYVRSLPLCQILQIFTVNFQRCFRSKYEFCKIFEGTRSLNLHLREPGVLAWARAISGPGRAYQETISSHLNWTELVWMFHNIYCLLIKLTLSLDFRVDGSRRYSGSFIHVPLVTSTAVYEDSPFSAALPHLAGHLSADGSKVLKLTKKSSNRTESSNTCEMG